MKGIQVPGRQFRKGSCPEQVYSVIRVNGPQTLHQLYKKIPKFSQTSIRRSIYELRDAFIIEKCKNTEKWQAIE